uniref:GPI inositol-deacylase n=1 Tax=Caenorhabditis japonica TaxID=281687 RepID=A0A8R1HKI0_CAEJA
MLRLFLSVSFLLGAIIAASDVTGPLTADFQSWLSINGYSSYDFVRSDYGTQGSYGGKTAQITSIVNTPVVFIHGNSDAALHHTATATGWSNSIQYFLDHGYTSAELYATSWQDTNALNAAKRTHDCKDLLRLRQFLKAVLDYTGSPKISVVSHSMGVTLARKIIKGGSVSASDGKCDLGLPLNKKVDVLIGISGANYGLCNCEGGSATLEKTCNKDNGLWPGDSCGLNILDCGLTPLPWPCSAVNYSAYLMQLNSDRNKEADHVYSLWSLADELIEYGNMVWGRSTSFIPTSDGKVVYAIYTHMQTKELTYEDQYQLVKNKTLPSGSV